MNANLVKYGKYGAVALIVGLAAYMMVQKNKKAKEDKALADAAAKKIADAKIASDKLAAKYGGGGVVNNINRTFVPLPINEKTGRPFYE
jgi:hypothetical protein